MTSPLTTARRVLDLEASELLAARDRLGDGFSRAVDLLQAHDGKLITTGLGKSALVARKIAASFSSIGLPGVFLHPVDALHGDAGVCEPGDLVLLVSNSGSTPELVSLLPVMRERQTQLIGILGRRDSPLGRAVDCLIEASVTREADAHNLIPTASCLLQMALGDALVVSVMEAREFTPEQFGRSHPGGQLGRNLRLRVSDVMNVAESVARLGPESPIKDVVIEMTRKPLGAACIVDVDGRLEGLITDGDLRRALVSHDDIRSVRASDIMTRTPVRVSPEMLLFDALQLMEERPSQISVMPVVEAGTELCLGLIRLHDIYQGHR